VVLCFGVARGFGSISKWDMVEVEKDSRILINGIHQDEQVGILAMHL
jgi:hypothetical protein